LLSIPAKVVRGRKQQPGIYPFLMRTPNVAIAR
jgi:hypothetical protein